MSWLFAGCARAVPRDRRGQSGGVPRLGQRRLPRRHSNQQFRDRVPLARPSYTSELSSFWSLRIARTKVLEEDQILGLAAIVDGDALARCGGGDEQLIPGHLPVAYQRRRLDLVSAEMPKALHQNRAVSRHVMDLYGSSRKHGEFFG